jgi:hypothetical protein
MCYVLNILIFRIKMTLVCDDYDMLVLYDSYVSLTCTKAREIPLDDKFESTIFFQMKL